MLNFRRTAMYSAALALSISAEPRETKLSQRLCGSTFVTKAGQLGPSTAATKRDVRENDVQDGEQIPYYGTARRYCEGPEYKVLVQIYSGYGRQMITLDVVLQKKPDEFLLKETSLSCALHDSEFGFHLRSCDGRDSAIFSRLLGKLPAFMELYAKSPEYPKVK